MRSTKSNNSRHKERGLTLYELLIVLAILALVATLVAPRVVGYLGRAKADTALTQMSNIANSLELYHFDMGEYPDETTGLSALFSAPQGTSLWRGPYMRDEQGLSDPWGRTYLYKVNLENETFLISTLGRDGIEGGNGDDQDLIKK